MLLIECQKNLQEIFLAKAKDYSYRILAKKELSKWENNLKIVVIIGSNYILQIEYGEIYYKHIG